MEKIIRKYYAENASKLHGMVDHILAQFGGISNKDQDDFYSLANEVFVDVMRRYDRKQSFDAFLYSCLSNKMKSEMTRRNRYKRRADQKAVSLDMPLNDCEDAILADRIPSNTDIEKEVIGEDSEDQNDRIERYLASLSKIQRKIIEMKMQDIAVIHIKEILDLTDKQYVAHMRQAVQYEHIRLLHI